VLSSLPQQGSPVRPVARLLSRAAVAGGLVLAVLAGTAAAAQVRPAVALAASPVRTPSPVVSSPAGTVRVDPERCLAPSSRPGTRVVCTVAEVGAHLIDRGVVVLSGVRHRGPLDLRGRSGVQVLGEPGAVLDAGGARFALSLRDVADVVVQDVVLHGGTAQTVWVERTRRVALRRVTVQGSAGSGVQVRDSAGFSLTASRVQDAASAGVMELTGVTDSLYAGLVVTRNGRGPAVYNGDGLQLAGTRVSASDVVVTANGSSPRYEHGVYVAATAREVSLKGLTASGNAGVAVKLGGSGTLERARLVDDRIALYCAPTAGSGWRVLATTTTAPQAVATERGCRLTR
jgi:hypothetical protein